MEKNVISTFIGKSTTMDVYSPLADYAKMIQSTEKKETLFFYDTGNNNFNTIPILLIHGLGDEADTWRHVIPVLCKSHRIIALDLPGFGRSKTKGLSNIQHHVNAVLSILEQTGPAILVGNSMGAIIAQSVACKRMDLAHKLILLDGGLPSSNKNSLPLLMMALPIIGKHWYRGLRKNHQAAFDSLIPFYKNLNELSEEDKNFLKKRVIERVESETQLKAYFSSLRSVIWTSLFQSKKFVNILLKYPEQIFVVWGEYDTIASLESFEMIKNINPKIESVILKNAGHLAQQEIPYEVAQTILNFIHKTI